jgi:Ca-activated chloride channel family protein
MDGRQHERLCAWLLGELDPAARAAFEAELDADPALQAERWRLERTLDLVRGLRDGAPALSEDRRARLTAAVPAARRGSARLVAAAVAVVALGGGGLLWWGAGSGLLSARLGADATRQDLTAMPAETAPSAAVVTEVPTDSAAAAGRRTLATTGAASVGLDPGQPGAFDGNRWNASLGLGGIPTAAPTEPTVYTILPTDSLGTATRMPGSQATFSDFLLLDAARGRLGESVTLGLAGAGDAYGLAIDLSALRYFADHDLEEQPSVFVPIDADHLFRDCRPRPDESPRDMYFRFWGDHAFVLTRTDALATFAADVDTASFVLARRYLRDGHLPTRAQVRTEEFVNYFDPDLAPPAEGDFAVHAELAPSPFGGSEARYLLRVGLRARVIPVERREALALTFVVDTSGSMREGQRLELVKHALLTLVSRLDGRDRIGIVTFSDDARLVLPMTAADAKAEIAAVVQRLQPDGSTNAEAGLRLGYELAATGLDPERHSRVVFLSDGVANVGQTDQERIAADVRERRDAGILLNTIGVGMGNHNDVFLEQLADRGDGVCDYVDDARAVQRAIVERFTGAFQPVAADVKIQVEFADGRVLRWRQLGYENRGVADQDFRNDAVDAGEVGSGHQVTALFELETAAADVGADAAPWATVRVRWMEPRRAGDDPARREAQELEQRVDAAVMAPAFDAASPGFRRAALVAQFAEVLRRSTHAAGDSYAELRAAVGELVRLPEFADDEDTAELVTLLQRAEELGITHELERSDLAIAVDEYRRHQYLRHQLAQLAGEARGAELEELSRHNDRLEARIRELLQRR